MPVFRVGSLASVLVEEEATTTGSQEGSHSSSSHEDESGDSLVIYTGHLDTAFCVTFALMFVCLAVLQSMRAILIRAKGKKINQFMTRLMLIFAVLSAAVRGVFFATMPANFDLPVYYLLWWIPEFFNLSACILLIRLWVRTYATARHVGEKFRFKKVRKWLSRTQYSLIAGMLLGQVTIWLAMLSSAGKRFHFFQLVDAYYLISFELLVIAIAAGALLSVHLLVRRAKRRGDPHMLTYQPSFPANLSRVDMMLLFWMLARVWRLADTCLGVIPSTLEKLIDSKYYWVYIGPFYFMTELAPGSLLIFSKVLEMLDHGMVNYRKMEKVNILRSPQTTFNYGSNRESSPGFLFFGSSGKNSNRENTSSIQSRDSISLMTSPFSDGEEDETNAVLEGVSVDPMVKNWTINYNELELIEFVGGGSGGEVWKAVYRDSVVAVKRLKKGLLNSPRDLADFCSEMRIISSLRHENVVSFYGACIQPPHICIVSEYLQRKSLRSVLMDERVELPMHLRVSMMIDLCKALRYVHSMNIIHRDLKPENLLVGAHFNLKVADFGSGTISPFSYDTKKSGMLLSIAGSNMYMAPEVYQRKYSYPADVYSAGIIFWEVYTRRPVFESGLSINDMVVARRRPALPEDMPPVLAQIVTQSWEHDPLLRPTFAEILRVFVEWQKAGLRPDFAPRSSSPSFPPSNQEEEKSENEEDDSTKSRQAKKRVTFQ
ncbi:protein kinase [Balamuthia mandrillaris]